MESATLRRESVLAAAFFVVISIMYLHFATDLPQALGDQPGPGRLPLAIGVALVFISVVNFVTDTTALVRRREEPSAERTDDQTSSRTRAEQMKELGIALLALGAWPFVVPLLGFAVGNLVVVAGVNRACGERSLVRNALVGVTVAVAAQIVFVHLMALPVPQIGSWGI